MNFQRYKSEVQDIYFIIIILRCTHILNSKHIFSIKYTRFFVQFFFFLFDFWALKCKRVGSYSFVNIKIGWGNIFRDASFL